MLVANASLAAAATTSLCYALTIVVLLQLQACYLLQYQVCHSTCIYWYWQLPSLLPWRLAGVELNPTIVG